MHTPQTRSTTCRRFAWLGFLLIAFAVPASVLAQNRSSSAQPSPPPSVSPATPSAPTEFTLPADKYQKAVDYSHAKYVHYFVNAFYGILVLVVIVAWRLGPKFRDWAEKRSSHRWLQLLWYAPPMLLTIFLMTLPSDLWDQSLDLKYGLSVQSWNSWITDWLTNAIIMLIVGTVLVWILYAVIRRSPRRWWFYFWLASLPVLLLVLFVSPVIIEPLFFKFTPLQPKHPELVAQLETVVRRGQMTIPPERMFEMNASSKYTGLNASVQGFGASKRVVVWDNTLVKATPEETLFVFGHEMGHYVLLHIPKEIAIDAFLLLILLYVGFRTTNWVLGFARDVRGVDDLASLPALMLVFAVLSFVATPIFDTVSRYFEHEADRYGLEVIHGIVPDPNQAAVQYFQMSGAVNLADPDPSPFIVFWLFDHPSRPQRIHFVSTYHPWAEGQPTTYVQ